jgi:hypothetical protein
MDIGLITGMGLASPSLALSDILSRAERDVLRFSALVLTARY